MVYLLAGGYRPGPDCGASFLPCPASSRVKPVLRLAMMIRSVLPLSRECSFVIRRNRGLCERIKAVKKLGHRLHADFCCDPAVLETLIAALQCDKCWEVRRAAAWAIQSQNARTEEGVLALYIASKLDPHYLVRVAAAEALDI